jgi:hypothetical protein
MTMDSDDIETRIRATLSDRAGRAPSVDLADAALSRARRIRRRRGALSAASVLVVAAVAVPVGLSLTDSSTTRDETATGPTESAEVSLIRPIHVQIAGLGSGDAPSVPYVHDSQFTYGRQGESVALPSTDDVVTDAAEIGSTAVWTKDASGATRVTTFSEGEPPALELDGVKATPPAIDRAAGGAAAFALQRADETGAPAKQDTIVYADSSGGHTAVQTSLKVRQVMGAANGVVVFNALDHGDQVVGVVNMSGSGDRVGLWGGLKTVTAVSPTLNLFAGEPIVNPAGEPDPDHCINVVRVDTGDVAWGGCGLRPVEFSADGSRVLAIDSASDGLGPRQLTVLDASNGQVLGTFRTPGTFGRATFEDDDTIVTVLVVGHQAAIVRCDLSGDCNLATEAQDVPADDPDSLVQPYQLTAN